MLVENHARRHRLSSLRDPATVQSMKALDRRDDLCRPILEAIPHIVWTASPDGSPTYRNRRGTELIGITAGQLSGWNWLQLLHPDDVNRSRQSWESALRSGREYVNEYRLRQRDGTYRWYLAKAAPLQGPDGGPSAWMGTCT